ncbi:hypothetical protein MKX03_028584 [Papaver bracteatum]|nr:hypothetical protein MKX03_028584 [Papaver bracteatum]
MACPPNSPLLIICTKICNNFSWLLSSDIEWWYHGPLDDHEDIEDSFPFVPSYITAFGSFVITISDDNGIVTQLREYFNTSLTIARFEHNWNGNTNHSSSSKPSRTSPLINSSIWESKLSSSIGNQNRNNMSFWFVLYVPA